MKDIKSNPMNVYNAFHFLVDIQNIRSGGFMEVRGLQATTEVETMEAGGVNHFSYKFPKRTKYSDITLLKGISNGLLYNWYQDVIQGRIERRNISIYILEPSGTPAIWWDIFEAFPVSWDGPKLNSMTSTIATEEIVLAHHGFRKSIKN